MPKYTKNEFIEILKKEEWCKQHKIPLLVIPYWDIDRIPEILYAFLAGEQPFISDPPQIVLEHESMKQEILNRLRLKNSNRA